MLNKLKAFMNAYRGEKVVCAVSGGADSMALLWGMYLLKDNLELDLSVAHFNHHLRGEESDRDEAFVRDFCAGYGIPFTSGAEQVVAGKKGLEAAARDARYAFLKRLPGKIATAHTADDNAETLLMHLVRGTGLKGLGGIMPVNGNLIRPMLQITRDEVLAFLEEYSIPYVEDSSNGGDDFLRNRLRHHVVPLLKQENPSLAENLSAMAARLRQDEAALAQLAQDHKNDNVEQLRKLPAGIRSRVLGELLTQSGVKEPEARHIQAMENLVFSENPSAAATFPGGVTFCRCYDTLQKKELTAELTERPLACPGVTELPELGVKILCSPNESQGYTVDTFPVTAQGKLVVRARQAGDSIRLKGGSKSVKKLLIDQKIPASRRGLVPVIADDGGVIALVGIGANLDRVCPETGSIRINIQYL